MCGIAGFAGPGDTDILDRMMNLLIHRGPDGHGQFIDCENRVHLGHRRLAIIDIEGGHQPMLNGDGSLVIVFNGEIYNHRDLRRDLEAKGHVFRTDHSDTEVLLHAYRQWGEDMAVRLNGMFAFALYDKAAARIFCARDRMGEKPFFYACPKGSFAFASELRALTAHPGVSRQLSETSLLKYFAYGYIPAPLALYEGTRKLPAGHSLRYDLADGRITVRPYWTFTLEPDATCDERGEDDLAEELRALLVQASSRRLMSDVPLGVFLSGGIDSSAVLASITKGGLTSQPPQTFTIGFTEESYDESPHARAVARHLGTRHHERILDISTARDLMGTVLPALDEPICDPSILPTQLLSRFTREHVTVALTGDGGDELFAGYDPFAALAPAHLYARCVPAPLHRALRRGVDMLPRSDRNMSLDFKLRRTLAGLSQPPECWAPAWMAPLEPDEISALFGRTVRPEELYGDAMAAWESTSGTDVDRLLIFFTRFYLQDDILTKSDRASMLSSLETRAVFLDNDIVDFARRLPSHWKYRKGHRKYILKKALKGWIPDQIIERKKKGFGIPISSWLRSVPREVPLEPLNGLDASWAAERWSAHRQGRRDDRLFLWAWLALQNVVHAQP